jgi:integrase
MAVKKRKGGFYIYFRPFKDTQIGLRVDAMSKTEAKQIEATLVRVCRNGTYDTLDSTVREVCIRMFRNRGWELPATLSGTMVPEKELTMWKACELFLQYPDIKSSPTRERYQYSLVNLVAKLGKERPVKSIWVPDLKEYQAERLDEGAAPGTVNWELATLSKLFGVLIELRLAETNPVRLVKKQSVKCRVRQVYIGYQDFERIVQLCPTWYQPIVQTAYYTGMRRGEILGLTRKQVSLERRLFFLGPDDTKEGKWKRVPVHRDLVPILEESMKVVSLETDSVFLIRDRKGVRPPSFESTKNPWQRRLKKMGLEPSPRFHDLRHTWRANARRSGVDASIAEAILGHWFKLKSVNDRYGRVSDQELIQAIDAMTFDHGETEILVASRRGGEVQ